jgi:hypothetical protein
MSRLETSVKTENTGGRVEIAARIVTRSLGLDRDDGCFLAI